MKRLSIVLLLLCPSFIMAQKAKETKGPIITFDKTEHNFGIFDVEHGDQTCYFPFTNTGDEPLVIKTATASCGCTTPEYSKREIAPGGRDSIKVTYQGSTRRPGTFKKIVTVTINSHEYDVKHVYITGEMVDKVATDRVLSGLKAD